MVRQSVQQSGRHAFSLEDLAPVAERKVAGDQQTATFVPIGEYLEQKLGPGPTERQITQLVDDQKVEFVQTLQHPIQSELFLSLFKLSHKRGRSEKLRPQSVSTGTKPQRNREMCFPRSRLAQQADVTSCGNPFAARKLQDLLLVDRRQR